VYFPTLASARSPSLIDALDYSLFKPEIEPCVPIAVDIISLDLLKGERRIPTALSYRHLKLTRSVSGHRIDFAFRHRIDRELVPAER
jgi:hypothetical protein